MAKEIKFEEAFSKLENIVDNLENGVNDLDKLVSLFEEGTKLVQVCQDKLNNAEQKIEVLSQTIIENKMKGENGEEIES